MTIDAIIKDPFIQIQIGLYEYALESGNYRAIEAARASMKKALEKYYPEQAAATLEFADNTLRLRNARKAA
jgi:hypothetical protein